jgi:kynurenine 3-monooxygenase
MKQATIIGSGLVGSLWAVYLNRAGYKVNVYERRPDMRKNSMSAGKSINLATSYRGWKALDAVGLGDKIREIAIPMYGRTMHLADGTTTYQQYGKDGEAIYSVSRGGINSILMDEAEKNANLYFNQECTGVDINTNTASFRNTATGEVSQTAADVVFATDGAFSAVRYHSMQRMDRFSYSQNYIPDGYKEILLPANADGSYKMAKNTLHIWPRGRFMLIALPNADGSFTCTLFMPVDGHEYCFNNLYDKDKVNEFFKNTFTDFYDMMPEVADTWNDHPLSSLAIIRCFPWHYGNTVLMGDAAHATVPFFGQGMNCGFEDCTVMSALMEQHGHDWNLVFSEYERLRKPEGDAVQDLSLQNYLVMRDKVADSEYQFHRRIERRIAELYPDGYFPLYSMVSFTDVNYSVAFNKGNEQELMVKDFIADHGIDEGTAADVIDSYIHLRFGK